MDNVRIELLNRNHDRRRFNCGIPELNHYLIKQANQDTRRHLASTYVAALSSSTPRVMGYYSLAASSVEMGDLPENIAKKLPRYPLVPATLLAHLAVETPAQNQGLGEHLLLDALYRSWQISQKIASLTVIVNAQNTVAYRFYEHYGFIAFKQKKRRLFLPMQTLQTIFA